MFYVYAYYRLNGTPYYIGKGSANRSVSTCRAVPRPVDPSRIKILKEFINEKDAFSYEKKLIKEYGRIDLGTGILRNMTDGGDGAPRRIWTEEQRKKVSEAKKQWHRENDVSGKNNPMYGKRHSQSIKDQSRDRALKNNLGQKRKGQPAWNKGLTADDSEAVRRNAQKISESRKKTPKKSCQHCCKMFAPNILARFHGEKCKLKPAE